MIGMQVEKVAERYGPLYSVRKVRSQSPPMPTMLTYFGFRVAIAMPLTRFAAPFPVTFF